MGLAVATLGGAAVTGCAGSDFETSDTDGAGASSGSGGGTGTGTGGGDGSGGAPFKLGCETSEITFKLTTASPDRSCLPSAGCGPSWITIRDEAGNIFSQNGACSVSCDECTATACPDVACTSVPFDRDVAFAWSGEFFAESVCDESACVRPSCAPAGNYVAEICLERAVPPKDGATECIPAGQLECDEVPFEWPDPKGQNQIVTLTLGNESP